jgi:hypothetical protein
MRATLVLPLGVLALSGSARADDPPREPPPAYGEVRAAPSAYAYEPAPVPPPLGHRGFQMAFRTGAAFPLGSAKDADPEDPTLPGGASKMSDLVSLQVPVTVDIGGKPNKFVFIGGYVSFGFGLAAGALSRTCDSANLDCRSASFRIGAQIHYAIAPDDFVNPWVGYGLGYTSIVVGDDGQRTTFRGFDFGHFMAGLDLRVSRTVGIGPFVDFTAGKYASRVLETQGHRIESDIGGRAFHYWVTVGPRIVLFP